MRVVLIFSLKSLQENEGAYFPKYNIFPLRGSKSGNLDVKLFNSKQKSVEDMGQSWFNEAPHLFLVLPSGGVQGLNKSCCMANKNSIASSSYNHTQHGEPDIW